MFRYYKGDPNHQILVQRQGRIRRSGLGLSFWYMPHTTLPSWPCRRCP